MVSPQNPNPPVGQHVTTPGRGFVTPGETQAAVYQPQEASQTAPLARSRISWGSVIAGSLLAISLLAFFGSLAYAIGIPAFAYGEYGWGAGIWSIITAAIAFYAGGCLAAYMAGHSDRKYSSMLHGAMAWVLAIPLILVLFAGTQGAFGQGGLIATNVVRTVISGAPLATNTPVLTAASLDAEPAGLSLTGAAWGAWLAMTVGLISAAIGGSTIRDRRDTAGEENRTS